MTARSLACLAACLLACSAPAWAEDWPQFRGPDRSGCSQEKGLLQAWPKGGPKLLWTYREAGLGYSGPAVVGDRLYTMGARGDTTYVLCLDVKTGKEVWHTKVGPIFTFQGNEWGDGPRSTPTVDGKLLYALGGYGDLVCLETDGGKEVWRKDLAKDLGGEMMSQWGYSHSPLVDGDRLVCMPGGPQGTLAALDKKTGAVLWRSKGLTDKATYSSPLVAAIGGVRQYVLLTYVDDAKGSAVAGVAADDGRLLWYQPFHQGSSYEVTPTPVMEDNLIYVTAEACGCQLLKVTPRGKGKFAVAPLYKGRTRKALENWHGGVVLVAGHIYGSEARTGKSGWVCQDLKTGKVLWSEGQKLAGRSGSIIFGDGRLYLYSDEGEVGLLTPSPKGWDEAGHFELPEKSKAREEGAPGHGHSGGIWTHPIIANGRLYLRDQELLFCYDIRKP
jgi:outer membrane protein assembly factor BamB